MKLPRDLSGTGVARRLARHYGYRVTRTRGSHMTVTLTAEGEQHQVTVPRHRDVRIGTLDAIIADVRHSWVCPSRQYATPSSVDVMAAELKPYRAYKDSGVEWLGAVPAHWEVRHLGRFGRLFKGGGGTKEDERESGVPCVRYGDLYTQHQVFITATRACVTPELADTVYTPIRYGDVLFAGSGETIDEIGKSAVNLIPGPACCGGDVIILRPSIDADARFLGYAMDCAATARQRRASAAGSRSCTSIQATSSM